MATENLFVSVDEHVQEQPNVWTKRLSRSKWGDRIPHIDSNSSGVDRWIVDGREVLLDGVADCGAAMPERTENPQRWSDVPAAVYDPKSRLKVMDAAGIDYAVLYPTVAGVGGQSFGHIDQASLRVRRYIGTENILWSSQFPLATSTWPNTRQALAKSFDGVAESDREKILWENAAKLYKIELNG